MKILVGYDGSKVSEDAVQLARKHGQAFKADVHLITSLEQGPDLKKEDIDKAESKLEKLKTPFKADGIPCETQAVVSVQSTGED
ncbi:MAG: universal stress protein, partial [Desulfobacterales bacterium]